MINSKQCTMILLYLWKLVWKPVCLFFLIIIQYISKWPNETGHNKKIFFKKMAIIKRSTENEALCFINFIQCLSSLSTWGRCFSSCYSDSRHQIAPVLSCWVQFMAASLGGDDWTRLKWWLLATECCCIRAKPAEPLPAVLFWLTSGISFEVYRSFPWNSFLH